MTTIGNALNFNKYSSNPFHYNFQRWIWELDILIWFWFSDNCDNSTVNEVNSVRTTVPDEFIFCGVYWLFVLLPCSMYINWFTIYVHVTLLLKLQLMWYSNKQLQLCFDGYGPLFCSFLYSPLKIILKQLFNVVNVHQCMIISLLANNC